MYYSNIKKCSNSRNQNSLALIFIFDSGFMFSVLKSNLSLSSG